MGGDGSLTHCLRALLATERVDLETIQFVTLPFGSGNDSARVFNWGATPNETHLNQLLTICNDITTAAADKLNIWDVTVTMDEMTRVGAGGRDESMKQSQGDKTFKYQMCNYYSIGQDVKVGYQVEQQRTGYRCCNYMCYGLCGFKYVCCSCCCWPAQESLSLVQMIDYWSISKQKDKKADIIEPLIPRSNSLEDANIVFAANRERNADYYLKGNPVALIAMNVSSYMGGTNNPWMGNPTNFALRDSQLQTVTT